MLKEVLQWAIEHGSLRTLEKINEAEALEPSIIDYITCRPSSKSDHAGTFETCGILPLHLAALYGQPAIVCYFLKKGADVNATVAGGLIPLHVAKTGEVVQILVAAGSHLDTVNGITPLLSSLRHHADSSAVAAFLQLGFDPNQAAECDGATPAKVAVDQGNVDALKVLLEAGADANQCLPGGERLIHRAVWYARPRPSECISPNQVYSEMAVAMIHTLVDHGASVNSGHKSTFSRTKRRFYTPNLFLAVMIAESADVTQALLERGADLHAAYSKKRNFIGPYNQQDAGFQTAFANTLVANLVGGLVNAPPKYVGQALVEPESLRKLALLVQHGGNIDAEIDHTTPLSYCLRQSKRRAAIAKELILPLLDLGADPCHQDKDGNQPIHLLTGQFYHNFQKWTEIRDTYQWESLAHLMNILIEKGADPSAKDALGRTPVMLLCLQPPTTPTVLLLKHLLCRGGIDVNATDSQGRTAVHHVIGVPEALVTDESFCRLQVLQKYSYGLKTDL